MGITIFFVLSTLLGQAESPLAPVPPREAKEARPILPGESGHILKMTREMIELARTHDSDRRAELFIRQAGERLNERKALEQAPAGEDRSRLGQGLGESYARLFATGAAGAIECGAAEGRDMSAASARYALAARAHHEEWMKVAAAGERSGYEGALLASGNAVERARLAQEAGRAFLAQERARDEIRSREKSPESPRPPSSPEKPPPDPSKARSEPPSAPPDPARPESEGERKERERKESLADHPRKEDREEPKPPSPDRHPAHPHRPHR